MLVKRVQRLVACCHGCVRPVDGFLHSSEDFCHKVLKLRKLVSPCWTRGEVWRSCGVVQVSYRASCWLRWRIQFQSTQNAGFHRFLNEGCLPSNLEQVCTVKLMSNRRARAARLQHQLVKVTMVCINLYSTNPNTSLILDLLSRKYEWLVKVSARTRM